MSRFGGRLEPQEGESRRVLDGIEGGVAGYRKCCDRRRESMRNADHNAHNSRNTIGMIDHRVEFEMGHRHVGDVVAGSSWLQEGFSRYEDEGRRRRRGKLTG